MALAVTRSIQSSIPEIRDKFYAAWARSDQIFDLLPVKAILAKPIVWRHPFIFYIGHLPAFGWNQISGAMLKWKSLDPYFDDIFSRIPLECLA